MLLHCILLRDLKIFHYSSVIVLFSCSVRDKACSVYIYFRLTSSVRLSFHLRCNVSPAFDYDMADVACAEQTLERCHVSSVWTNFGFVKEAHLNCIIYEAEH